MLPQLEEYLEHHGTKGMKWGVRRAPGPKATGRIGLGDHTRVAGIGIAGMGLAIHYLGKKANLPANLALGVAGGVVASKAAQIFLQQHAERRYDQNLIRQAMRRELEPAPTA